MTPPLARSAPWPISARSAALLLGACLGVLAGCDRPSPQHAAQARRIEADLRALADDRMAGRAAGTPGFDRAAGYVAARLRDAGLRPDPTSSDSTAADPSVPTPSAHPGSTHATLDPTVDGRSATGSRPRTAGYLQPVPLWRLQRRRDGGTLAIHRDGATTALRWRVDFLPELSAARAQAEVTAPAVYVGYGVHAPALGHDDLRGVDLRGRIAVLRAGVPAYFDRDARAVHAPLADKLHELDRRGAVGAVLLASADDERAQPWAQVAAQWARPRLALRSAAGGDEFRSLRVVASVAAAASARVLGRELHAAPPVGPPRGVALPGTLTLGARQTRQPLASSNVVGWIAGRDPALANAPVVVSAHLDHLGVVDGAGEAAIDATTADAGASASAGRRDRIHNGALDNALGVAIALEAARELARAPARRPIVLLASTGEEHGLLGARWWIGQRAPAQRPVAAINLDMPRLLAPTHDVVVLGAQRSTLQPLVRRAAAEVGVALTDEPWPELHAYTRSDQYAFVRAGIPALYVDGGVDTRGFGDAARERAQAFLRQRYHSPRDDATQPIDYRDAARLARLTARIAAHAANAAPPPRWHDDDYFGRRFAAPAATAAGRRSGHAASAASAASASASASAAPPPPPR